MNILTWNVNGYRSALKNNYIQQILDLNPDIICFQEVKMNEEIIKAEGYNIYYNFAQKLGYSGVAVLTKEEPLNVVYNIGEERFDNEGRFILLEFEKFILINVYIPQGGRQKENLEYKLDSIDRLIKVLDKYKDKKIIIATDFNIAHNEIDVLNYKTNYNNIMFTREERDKVNQLLEKGYMDCFRTKYTNEQVFSWWSNAFKCRERNIGWRIDYFFALNILNDNVENIEYLTEYKGSDHCPLCMKIKI